MPNRMTGDIIKYWSKRAPSYSELNRNELEGDKTGEWLDIICGNFPDKKKSDIKILDIGTGPGFFAILLAKNGFLVDAVDITANMLKEAETNAGEYAKSIAFHEMNADDLGFEDNTFDIILNRNLTWNLEDPCICYAEWKRVLKPGGRAIIFDANWYNYLFDLDAKKAYDEARINVAKAKLTDFNIGQDFDVMEDIARKLPMSEKVRPLWDKEKLLKLGFSDVYIDNNIWENVWTDEEIINYTGTPMFMICAVK